MPIQEEETIRITGGDCRIAAAKVADAILLLERGVRETKAVYWQSEAFNEVYNIVKQLDGLKKKLIEQAEY